MMQVVIYTSLNVIYDEKGQCVSKGLPGCDPIIYRYDKGNIPVLPYCRPQFVSYYDDYLFMDDLVTSETKRVLSCDTLSNYGIPVVGTDKSKGFLTGTAVYSLADPMSKTVSSFYYDYQGRLIQSHRKEALGGDGHIHQSLTFTGKPSRTRETVALPDGRIDSLVTVRSYDGQDRLVSETTSLNDKSQSVSYGYDEIGRLTSRVYGTAANPSALTETLAYNIRDQLTDQNSNVFNMSLRYQEPTLGAVPKYNGSVSEWEWNHGVGTETNAWSLSYDGVGRLTDAQRFVGGVQTNSFSERSITYDRNSNALTLTRYGENAATPDEILAYSYNGNLLRNISNSGTSGGGGSFTHDTNGNLTRDGLSTLDIDYNDRNLTSRISSGGATLAEYEYLADGTKLRALDGGGNGYQYRGSLIYTQTAGQSDSPVITLDCALTSAGRIARETSAAGTVSYRPLIHLCDHLGSVRSVIDGDTGIVVEASDYYPFGKRIQVTAPVSEPVGGSLYAAEPVVAPVAPATSVASTSSPNRWRFSGKEDQSFLGASIPLLDFGARMYNPAIARWTASDPMSEKYYGISPYVYCANNPILFTDIAGNSYSEFDVEGNYKRTVDDNWWHNLWHGRTGRIVNDQNEVILSFKFADPKNDVKDLKNGTLQKIQFVEEKDVVSMLSKAGVFDEKNKTANNTLLDRYSYVLHEGKGGHKMDFSYNAIPDQYEGVSTDPLDAPSPVLFLIDGVAHNHMNFGNFLFGAGGKALGLTSFELRMGAQFNSIFNPGSNNYKPQFDSNDDQFSIRMGVRHARQHHYKEMYYRAYSQKPY